LLDILYKNKDEGWTGPVGVEAKKKNIKEHRQELLIHTTRCFQGLLCFDDRVGNELMPEYLSYLREMLERNADNQFFGARAVCKVMYPMKEVSLKDQHVNQILKFLTKKMDASTEALDAGAMSSALHGMQNMCGTNEKVRELIPVLTRKIGKSPKDVTMNGEQIADALFGLRGLDSEDKLVQPLLQTLPTRISRSKYKLSIQNILDGIAGLKGCRSMEEPYLKLVKAFVKKMFDSKDFVHPFYWDEAVLKLRSL
jgi:hypothetical protein